VERVKLLKKRAEPRKEAQEERKERPANLAILVEAPSGDFCPAIL